LSPPNWHLSRTLCYTHNTIKRFSAPFGKQAQHIDPSKLKGDPSVQHIIPITLVVEPTGKDVLSNNDTIVLLGQALRHSVSNIITPSINNKESVGRSFGSEEGRYTLADHLTAVVRRWVVVGLAEPEACQRPVARV